MSVNTRLVSATPEQVWDVLADGWLYPVWVVGASRMREVEDAWPAPGSKLHHSVGTLAAADRRQHRGAGVGSRRVADPARAGVAGG